MARARTLPAEASIAPPGRRAMIREVSGAMGKIKVLAGDFTGDGSYSGGRITLRPRERPSPAHRMVVRDFFQSIDVAAQHNVVNLGGAVGWGAAGGLLAGPLGLLAGAVLGGRGRDVVFVAVLKDGRRLLAQTDSRTYTQLRADVFPDAPSQA